ncbi:response regulator receiver domain protein (CheY) [Microseira wollei NIES-4236]|uniref:Response regulator receiver domain protein (CheY) n=2 Tax=Microseira wollei TaxID=467598 RepID=A0AAV3XJ20_9CYAN|nr:response regulator receiver domain protein (CheY) [Microseira wollei NIES-4236]
MRKMRRILFSNLPHFQSLPILPNLPCLGDFSIPLCRLKNASSIQTHRLLPFGNLEGTLTQTMIMEISRGSGEQPITQRPLVLAVDDNEDNLGLISFSLDLFGFAFISAPDGQTTLKLAQTHQPDLILLDIMLPDLDGIEVVRRLKQDSRTKSIKIIAVTALARDEDRDRILESGCEGYISKPYMVDDLEALLRRYLT